MAKPGSEADDGSADPTWRCELVAPEIVRLSVPRSRRFVNVYLIGGGNDWTLIDAAEDVAVSRDALFDFLEREREIAQIRQIFLTHGHPDHVGLAEELCNRFDSTVVAHSDTLRGRLMDCAFLLRHGLHVQEAARRRFTPMAQIHPRRVRYVADGDILDAGRYRFRLLWTPGHHPGHLCAFDQSSGLLISGDRVLRVPTPIVRLAERPRDPLSEHLRSFERLRRLRVQLVLPGHGRTFVDADAALDRDRASHVDAVSRVLAAIPPDGTDAITVASTLEIGGGDEVTRLARVLAVLSLLEERSMICSDQRTDPVRFHRLR